MDTRERLAVLAAEVAATVDPGMRVGLGSGSTAEAVVDALGRRVRSGLRILGVATSTRTERLAIKVGIPLVSIDEVDRIDLGIDGADEIDPQLNLTKGRGGALLYEKLVARACQRFIVVGVSEKLVPVLGTRMPLPVEIVPFGWRHTAAALSTLNLRPRLRIDHAADDSSPVRTDGGHYILDCQTGPIKMPETLAGQIKGTPGVVEHGLFVGMASCAVVVDPGGHVSTISPLSSPANK